MNKDIAISERRLFNAQALAKNGDSGDSAEAFADLSKTTGECKLQYAITGSGTVKIEVKESIRSGVYITKSPELGTTLTGSGIITYDAAGIPFVNFVITEDGGADPENVTMWLSAL